LSSIQRRPSVLSKHLLKGLPTSRHRSVAKAAQVEPTWELPSNDSRIPAADRLSLSSIR